MQPECSSPAHKATVTLVVTPGLYVFWALKLEQAFKKPFRPCAQVGGVARGVFIIQPVKVHRVKLDHEIEDSHTLTGHSIPHKNMLVVPGTDLKQLGELTSMFTATVGSL